MDAFYRYINKMKEKKQTTKLLKRKLNLKTENIKLKAINTIFLV